MFVFMNLYICTRFRFRFTHYRKRHSPSFGIPLDTESGDFDVVGEILSLLQCMCKNELTYTLTFGLRPGGHRYFSSIISFLVTFCNYHTFVKNWYLYATPCKCDTNEGGQKSLCTYAKTF